jgi:methionine synthase II (cobalamin-independent)
MRFYSARQAAHELLGWSGRRCDNKLTRKIRCKEKKLGREVFQKTISQAGRTIYQIDELTLKAEFPELFIASTSSIALELKTKIEEVKNDIQSLVQASVDKRLSQIARQLSLLKVDMLRIEEASEKRFADIDRKFTKSTGRAT